MSTKCAKVSSETVYQYVVLYKFSRLPMPWLIQAEILALIAQRKKQVPKRTGCRRKHALFFTRRTHWSQVFGCRNGSLCCILLESTQMMAIVLAWQIRTAADAVRDARRSSNTKDRFFDTMYLACIVMEGNGRFALWGCFARFDPPFSGLLEPFASKSRWRNPEKVKFDLSRSNTKGLHIFIHLIHSA